MKRKIFLQVISFLCILFIISGFAANNQHLININSISVVADSLSTKIILEANSPLAIESTYFAQDSPPTLVVALTNIQEISNPVINGKQNLIKNIKIDKKESGRLNLFIDLTRQVPYTIISDENNTIIELIEFQNKMDKDSFQQELENLSLLSRQKPVQLNNISISEEEEKLSLKARLNGEVFPYVFALDKPLRLVVDLYHAYFTRPPMNIPVNKMGIKQVRAAQFQINNPHTITRLVFDLEKAKYYSMNSDKGELIISFFEDESAPFELSQLMTPVTKEEVLTEETAEESSPTEKINPAEENKAQELKNSKSSINTEPSPPQSQEEEQQFQPKIITALEEQYSGEIISLKFKDADLRDVVLYLANFAGLNVVFDPGVRGTVTVDLEDVPWDQALDLILKINKMGKSLEGNVLRIAPVNVLTQEQQEIQRLQESKELAGPIQVKTFTLSYSKASEIQQLLRTKLSNRGEIIIDERTNTLIITEVKDRMELMEKLISVFDTATPQVSIEARIVEATSTFIRNLGIQWGWRGISDPFYGNQTSLQFPNKMLVDGAMIPQGIVTKGIGGPLGGYAINLPAPAFSTSIGLSVANVLDTFRLDMALSAMETSGTGRIISAPTVTTQNNKEANIIQGRQIPVQTVANFTVTTRYVNAALELKATPQITAEGTIIMYLEIQNNAADFANLVNGIPPIITQSASTTVMVPDGGTTIIGGIYRTEDSITRERVPFFHKIPILGNLFKSFARTKQNRELLIFITPRIIK